MFFVIYQEMSNDTYFSGRDLPLVTPTLAFEGVSRQRAEFLATQVPCWQLPPATVTPDPDIIRFDNCHDHRYMFAQTLLNGLITFERTESYNATDSTQLMGKVFQYLWGNFDKAVGASAELNSFWAGFQCSFSADGLSFSDYRAVARHIRLNGFGYGYAVKWLDNFLNNCVASNTRVWVSWKNRLGIEIQRAIDDFYAQQVDPTRANLNDPNSIGAFTFLTANISGTSIPAVVGCTACGGQYYYSPQWYESAPWVDPRINPPPTAVALPTLFYNTYATHIPDVADRYVPNASSIIQPALRFEEAPIGSISVLTTPTLNYPNGGHSWFSLVYQKAPQNTIYVPRYSYNVCLERGVSIANCLDAQLTPNVPVPTATP